MGWVYSQVAYNSRISDSGNMQRLWVSVPEGVFFAVNGPCRDPGSESVKPAKDPINKISKFQKGNENRPGPFAL